MKRLSIFLMALLLMSIGAKAADETDLTSSLQNPSFEADATSVSSWTFDNTGDDPSGDNFFAAIEAIQDAYASIAAYAADLKGGDYLIVNQEGYYLGGGLAWGTQASIIGKPQFIGFEVQSDGTYHLDSHQYNSASDHYLGSNLYFDNGTPVDWTVEAVDGGYTIYNSSLGYLTSNGFQEAASVETAPYIWTLLTMDDVVASMSEASATNPVDVTALIKAPELKHNSNTTYYPTWTCTGYSDTGAVPANYSFGQDGNVASCAESYHSTNGFNFSQEITLPKAGYYTLSAKGFWREDDTTTELSRPVLYAGDATSTFPQISRTDEYLGQENGDNMANAYQEFLLGLHSIDAIPITATQDGETITIGFKGDDTSLWHIMGELELLYYADAPAHECTADISHWSIDPTTPEKGDFHQNTWSTEADASDLTTPFLEYWVYQDLLSAATISHDQLTGLTPGVYEVSLTIRVFSEAGNDIEAGTTFNANGVSEDVASGSDSNEDIFGDEVGVYGTYTLTCVVDGNGTLDISIVIPEDVTYNWISFKDLKVVYIGELSVDWEMTAAGYGTLILPFDASVPDGLTAYTIGSVTTDDTNEDIVATLSLTESVSIAANTPYIMGGTEGKYTFTGTPTNTKDSYTSEDGMLTGTFVDMSYSDFTADGTEYLLQNHDDEVAFYPVVEDKSSAATLTPYHCYLTYSANGASPAKLVFSFAGTDDETTAIEAVEGAEAEGNGAIYDLSGRRVAKAVKGVYIQNGKKVLVK